MKLTHQDRVKLIAARRDLELTQEALADRLGLSQSMIARYETGDKAPTADRLRAWAKAVGLRVKIIPARIELTKQRKA